MRRSLAVLSLLFCSVPVLAQLAADKRPAWKWSNAERAASLLDPQAAADRVDADIRNHRSVPSGLPPEASSEHRTRPLDVIDGRRNPELFFPQQLFASLLGDAFLSGEYSEEYRRGSRARLLEFGLPADTWEIIALESDAALNEKRALLAARAETPATMRPVPDPCPALSTAYSNVRRRLGEALDVYLYTVVAPGMQSVTTHRPSPSELRRRAGECR